MYENPNPFPRYPRPARALRPDGETMPSRGGDALRAVAWHELTARLSAARDFRSVLRQDARSQTAIESASFTDAAASYFRALGHSEPAINPNSIDDSKACDGIKGERDDALAAGAAGGNRALPLQAGDDRHDESMGEIDND